MLSVEGRRVGGGRVKREDEMRALQAVSWGHFGPYQITIISLWAQRRWIRKIKHGSNNTNYNNLEPREYM